MNHNQLVCPISSCGRFWRRDSLLSACLVLFHLWWNLRQWGRENRYSHWNIVCERCDQPVRANTGPLPRHRSPAEVRHLLDEEARGSARICGVGCGINAAVCFVVSSLRRLNKRRSTDYCNILYFVRYRRHFSCLYFPAVRYSADLPSHS